MASKVPAGGRESAASDSLNTTKGNENASGNNSGATRKSTIVKSRYLEKKLKPRPDSPKRSSTQKSRVDKDPRHTMSLQHSISLDRVFEPLMCGEEVLHSTRLDDRCNVSAVKGKTMMQRTKDPETEKKVAEMQTFLLAFITAKMYHNTQKLLRSAEADIYSVIQVEEECRAKLYDKKQKHLLLEKQNQLNNLIDLQMTAMNPVAVAAKRFTANYQIFAAALDTTRHELPVRNFYMDGDQDTFICKAVECLNQSETVLQQHTHGALSQSVFEQLTALKATAQDVNLELDRGLTSVLELSSLVSQETVQIQQTLEEAPQHST
ncbi:HAUS augmin-like complex subunit 8 [Denticeps clupeoides]|uniref:HAUS augmin-like complex subunit 8 n=1 Tax=Denticeps clupeoides TaxID=299321 RepID=UPI0010A2B4DA|nr:HAUS augmin-like complex subunit 8 [Denticeps clupeoides]